MKRARAGGCGEENERGRERMRGVEREGERDVLAQARSRITSREQLAA
jgi:hypothetical protein